MLEEVRIAPTIKTSKKTKMHFIVPILKNHFTIEKLITISTIFSLCLIWYIVTDLKLLSDIFIPSPAKVASSFQEIIAEGYKGDSLLRHLGDSMFRLLVAFVLAVITGVPLGLASGYNSKIRAVVDPLVEFYRPLPPLAYYSLLIIWMGIDNSSKIALLFLAAFAPVYIACMSGVKSIKTDYIDGAFTLGASNSQIFWHVILPASLPEIFVGMRTSIGVAYTTLVAAEMVAAVSGIGWMVLDASKFLRSDIIFVGIFIMGITGILIDRGIRIIENRIVPWKGQA